MKLDRTDRSWNIAANRRGRRPARTGRHQQRLRRRDSGGGYFEGIAGPNYGEARVLPPRMSGPLVQPQNKGERMEERLAAKPPLVRLKFNLFGPGYVFGVEVDKAG